VDLVKTRRNRGLQQRQELAFSLYPDGLVFSRETLFFEPRNDLLMNGMEEMVNSLLAGNVGAPPVQILNRLAQIRALLLRLNYTARPCD